MAYIGRNPAIGTQKVLDSLESQFNGTLTTFDLRYNTNTIYPPIASALIVSLGGVLQEPGVAYTVASDTITFASPPPTGADCWILLYTEFGAAGGGSANFTVSNNLTIGNELHGPTNFVIDPATIGDNTGTVEIKGNLTVQGTQTTVNSTTVDLDHLSLGDDEIANFGDSNDLQIYHDSTSGGVSYIKDAGAGALRILSNTLRIRPTNDIGHMAIFQQSGSVELYYDNSKKFETGQFGVTVTGSLAASNIELEDNGKLLIGTGDDLEIYHDGSHSYISDQGQGNLKFLSNNFRFSNADESKLSATFVPAGAASLYYDNSVKLDTTTGGIDVTGLTNTDTLSVSGSSTFNGNTKHFDGKYANFGNSTDLQIVHDGSNSVIQNATGQFFIDNNSSGGDLFLRANDNVAIRVDGNDTVFTARTGGVTITGALEVSAATNLTVGGTALPSLTGLLGGSLDGTLGTVTMAYLASAPSSPVQGQFYFNSLSQKAQIYTGSSFVDLVPSGGGGGGGGGSSTDANATFRKYTYSVSSVTNSITGSSDAVVSAGSFIVGYKYTIKTVGTTNFTAIGASANTVGTVFTATGAGSGTGDAYDTLFYSTGGDQNVEVYVNGVKAVEGSTNDYVATSGTSVNFVANLASGDVVDIQVYELLTNDAYVLATGGTFTGNVGINTSTINNRLHIHSNANLQGILLTQQGSNYSSIISDANRTAADNYIMHLRADWNGTEVAHIVMESGNDTTNKDDGRIKFGTATSGGSIVSRMHISPSGSVAIGYPEEYEGVAKLDVKGQGTLPTGLHNYTYAGGSGIRIAGVESALDIVGENIGQHASSILLRNENEGFSIHNRPDTDSLHFKSFTTDATSFTIHDDNNVSASVNIMSFLKGGNVGIGSTQPAVKFDVAGSAKFVNPTPGNVHVLMQDGGSATPLKTATTLRVVNSGNSASYSTVEFESGSGKFVMLNSGNVGIGTDNPTSTLMVSGSVGIGNTTAASGAGRFNVKPHNSHDSYFKLRPASDFDGLVIGSAIDIRNSANNDSHHLIARAEEYRLWCGDASSEQIRITNTGNVGIGTNNPAAKLNVNGQSVFNSTENSNESNVPLYLGVTAVAAVDAGAGAACSGVLRIKDKGANNNRFCGIDIRNRNSGDIRILNYDTGTSNQADMVFAVDVNNTDSIVEAMRIKGSTQNVGIGTVTPEAKVDIYGETDSIWLHKTSNAGGVGIAFSDHFTSTPKYEQKGYFRFYHSDTEAFGHNAAFTFTSTETSQANGFTVFSQDDFTAVGTLIQNYSDERLKTIHGRIDNPLEKLSKIHGYYYIQNETADELGFKERGQRQVGVSAQEIQEVLPEVIRVAPISYTKKAKEEYYTVQYERVIPLLIESIKAQQELIEKLQQRLEDAGL